MSFRNDAALQPFYEHETFQHVVQQAIRQPYDELKTRRFIPTDFSIPKCDTVHRYDIIDHVGKSIVKKDCTVEAPRVNVGRRKETVDLEMLGNSLDWCECERLLDSELGISQVAEKMRAARDILLRDLDEVAAIGLEGFRIQGLANNSDVNVAPAPTGNWLAGIDADGLVADIMALLNQYADQTKCTFDANTILMPCPQYRYLRSIRIPGTSDTLLEYIRKLIPRVVIEEWRYLSNLNVDDDDDGILDGPRDRMIAYRRDPSVLKQLIPMDVTFHAPETYRRATIVDVEAKTGGVAIYQPVQVLYMDGI